MAIIGIGGYASTPKKVAPKRVVPTTFADAVKAFKPTAATIKAIAPTQAAKNVLGPKFGGTQGWANVDVPEYMLPATPVTAPGTETPVPRSSVPSNYQATLADILAHPLSAQALGQYNTNQQSLMRQLRSNLGQSIIQAGYDPSAAFQKLLADRPDLGEFADLIDPTALTAAKANPLSARAQNEQAYTRGVENLGYSLAARGMGRSGASATGTNQLLQSRQLAENTARDALLNALQGGISGYLDQRTQGYNQLQDVYGQVAQLLAQQAGAVYPEGNEDLTDVQNAQATEQLIPGTNVPSAASPPVGYVPWGGLKMRSVADMKSWLKARGMNWDTWARQHTNLARQLLDLGG